MKRMLLSLALCATILTLAGCSSLPKPEELSGYAATVNEAMQANNVRGTATLYLPTDIGMHWSTTFGSKGYIMIQVSGDAGE
jgi:hypothetical protein